MARDPYKNLAAARAAGRVAARCLRRHITHPSASILAAAPARAARATHYNERHMLPGDLGGTKTLLGLFRQTGTARPEMVVTHEFATPRLPSAGDILAAFLQKVDVAADPSTPPASASGR
jgi:hypothetical protein